MTGGMCFSPDGARLIAGDYDTGVIQVWEVESGRAAREDRHGKATKRTTSFIVSPDWKTDL